MGKLFYKNLSVATIIMIFFSFLILPMCIQNCNDLFVAATSSNYITLVLNNLYIYIIYKRIAFIRSLYDKIINRIGMKTFLKKYLFYILISIGIYFFVLYGGSYCMIGLSHPYIIPFFLFLGVNFFCFMIQELICMLAFDATVSGKIIILPILLNLFFHYTIAPWILSFYV